MEFITKIKITVEVNKTIFAPTRDEATKKAGEVGEKLLNGIGVRGASWVQNCLLQLTFYSLTCRIEQRESQHR